MPAVREQLGYLAAHAGMVNAMLAGMEATGNKWGEYYLPNRHHMYSAQVLTQELYPRFINTIRELAGGAFIMLPSSFKDWHNPEIQRIIHKTQRSAALLRSIAVEAAKPPTALKMPAGAFARS